jgi:hypothetical protein
MGTARAIVPSAIFSLPGDVCGHLRSSLTRSEFAAREKGHRARRAVCDLARPRRARRWWRVGSHRRGSRRHAVV